MMDGRLGGREAARVGCGAAVGGGCGGAGQGRPGRAGGASARLLPHPPAAPALPRYQCCCRPSPSLTLPPTLSPTLPPPAGRLSLAVSPAASPRPSRAPSLPSLCLWIATAWRLHAATPPRAEAGGSVSQGSGAWWGRRCPARRPHDPTTPSFHPQPFPSHRLAANRILASKRQDDPVEHCHLPPARHGQGAHHLGVVARGVTGGRHARRGRAAGHHHDCVVARLGAHDVPPHAQGRQLGEGGGRRGGQATQPPPDSSTPPAPTPVPWYRGG